MLKIKYKAEGVLKLEDAPRTEVNSHHEGSLADSCRFGILDTRKNTSPHLTGAGSYRAVFYLP
jgi:hypothetical protein